MDNPNQITIDQTLNLLSSINYKIMEAEKKDDQNKKVSGQKAVDSISTAGITLVSKDRVSGTEETPQLAAPSSGDSDGGLAGSGSSIVAIIGAILMLQAQASSNFYSLQWNQGTQMMSFEIELAPVISNATIASAEMQSAATQAQADESWWSGVFNAIGAGVAVIAGVTGTISELNTAMKEVEPAAEDTVKTAEETLSTVESDTSTIENETETEKTTSNILTKESDSSGKRFNRAGQAMKNTIMQSLKKGLGKGFSAGLSASQAGQMVAGIGTGFTGSIYKSRAAEAQAEQGQDDATAKVGEQLTKFFDQGYSRTSELNQETSKAFDTTTQTLDQIISTILRGVQKLYS